jgi:TadE-like protein
VPTGEPERGQASVELVAVLPILLALALLAAQVAIAGYGAWTAANAARAGARASAVDGDVRTAAASAVPAPFRPGIEVRDGHDVSVALRAPSLLPGVEGVPARAVASLVDGADGG